MRLVLSDGQRGKIRGVAVHEEAVAKLGENDTIVGVGGRGELVTKQVIGACEHVTDSFEAKLTEHAVGFGTKP